MQHHCDPYNIVAMHSVIPSAIFEPFWRLDWPVVFKTVLEVSVTYFRGNCPDMHKESNTTPIQNLSGKVNAMLSASKEKGQGLIEYAIILSLVALIVIAVVWLLGPTIGNSYSSINSSMP